MKHALLFSVLLGMLVVPPLSGAQDRGLQHGTIIKMRMADCVLTEHGFMAALSGTTRVQTAELCPEYVLLGDQVVYTIIAKSSTDFLPLAEVTKFRFRKNQLLIRIDDAKHETRFEIKAMMLRADWERLHQLQAQEEGESQPWHHFDSSTVPQNRP